MKNRKWMDIILSIVFVVLVPLMFLLTDVQLVAFDRDYFKAEYNKYNIPAAVGIEMDELMRSTEKLLDYMGDQRADLDFKALINGKEQEFFSQRDKLHMVDVKNLFTQGYNIRNLSFLFFLLLFFYFIRFDGTKGKNLARLFMISFAVGLIPIFMLIILMNIDFYKYFTVFHQIFFNNDLWLLDPAVDRLVNLYPENFFSDMAFRIVYFYIAELFAIFIGSFAYIKYLKKKDAAQKN